ncbi:MAG TPA: hypothetical protein VGL26_08315, partial [Jatrophihabitans sp.]
FVGRDRGYRALGFTAAGALPLQDEPVGALGAAASVADCQGGWLLVLDAHRHPQGWLSAQTAAELAGRPVTPDVLNLGGTLAPESGTLRAALDAALSSPSGRGVVVHDDGSLAGTVTASQVLERIEAERAVHPLVGEVSP